MADRKFLIFVPLALFSGLVAAGYAQMSPPPNWTTSAGASVVKVAANDVSFAGGVRSSSAVLNVGGRAVSMPVAYRFAANAGRVAAGSSFGSPLLFGALTVGMVGYEAYKWYTDNQLLVDGGVWKKVLSGIACAAPNTCYQWALDANASGGYMSRSGWKYSRQDAANAWAALANASPTDLRYSNCSITGVSPAGTVKCDTHFKSTNAVFILQATIGGLTNQIIPPYDFGSKSPVTKTEMENLMDNKAVPLGVPQVWPLPDIWWPVEPMPIINPTAEPVPKPNPVPVPAPQPMRVPVGDPQAVPLPVPNPENIPQTWKSPVVDVVPSPTVNEPWRVDVQPKDIISTSPSPLPLAPVPVTPPAGETAVKPDTPPGLCDQYPDILACKKTDTPESDELKTQSKEVTVAADSGWGASSASCPAVRRLPGAKVDFSFQPMCDALAMFKPLILAIAWLSAGMILIGARGGD